MAIYLAGSTVCPLCRRAIEPYDDRVGFPHFIRDRAHPLSPFSDSVMHRACFAAWNWAEAFRAIFDAAAARLARPRRLTANGDIIDASAAPDG